MNWGVEASPTAGEHPANKVRGDPGRDADATSRMLESDFSQAR